MLIWKPGNFKILIIGSQLDVIPKVERRIGKVISLPIEIHVLSFDKLNEANGAVATVDLILVEKNHEKLFKTFSQRLSLSPKDFIPSLLFELRDDLSEEEIDFWP